MKRFDSIVIGAGQAGPSLARRLAAAGHSVAIVERGLAGGTCVNTGCMPTKTLIASARAAHVARHGAKYGVMVSGPIGIDFKRAMARAHAVSAASRRGIESSLRETARCTLIHGHARFIAKDTVEVGGDTLRADRIFINVGGRARIPKLGGIDDVPHLTNSSILALDVLPRHLLVIGGGPVGLELAQMFRRFGSEVTIIEMGPRLLAGEDEEVSKAVTEIFVREGIHVRVGAECISLARDRDGITAGLVCASGEPRALGSHVLLATGRVPNTDDLGLDRAGVVVDGRGYIVIDDQLRTNVPGIWALGECNGHGAFTHTAYNDYEIVAANVLDQESRKVTDRIEAYAIFVDPPLARAGMSATAARKTRRPHLFVSRPMTRVSRAVEKGETEGFMQAICDARSGKIVGATILGTDGDEAIHALLYAMYHGATTSSLARCVGIHPTIAELLPTLIGELKPLT